MYQTEIIDPKWAEVKKIHDLLKVKEFFAFMAHWFMKQRFKKSKRRISKQSISYTIMDGTKIGTNGKKYMHCSLFPNE